MVLCDFDMADLAHESDRDPSAVMAVESRGGACELAHSVASDLPLSWRRH
jgi:hypothetical protein